MTDLADRSIVADPPPKPRLRGVSHQVAFFVSLVLGPVLVLMATTPRAQAVSAIYAVCLAALFGCSAMLHRGDWSTSVHPWICLLYTSRCV